MLIIISKLDFYPDIYQMDQENHLIKYLLKNLENIVIQTE